MKTSYFDNFRYTPLLPSVQKIWNTYDHMNIRMPSAPYRSALEQDIFIETTKNTCAQSLNASPENIYFGPDYESTAYILISSLLQKYNTPPTILISEATLPHLLIILERFEKKKQIQLIKTPVDGEGFWEEEKVKDISSKQQIDIVMIDYVNHMLGTIQDIPTLQKNINEKQEKKPLYYCDATYAYGAIPINSQIFHCDIITCSGHTMGGPWGISAICTSQKHLYNLFDEKQNIYLIRLFGAAIEERFMHNNILSYTGASEKYALEWQKQRNLLYNEIQKKIPDTLCNGPLPYQGKEIDTKRHPGHLNITFEYIEGEALTLKLSFKGHEVTTGSACSHKALLADYALLAIGRKHEDSHGSLRFTFGWNNHISDINSLMKVLPDICTELREISSFQKGDNYSYDEIKKS
jgi:cysteine desulfurase